MPVRYAPMIPPASKEFVEPVADDYFIWWLFRNRCVSCRKPGQEINEIIPRSRSKNSILNWENRVLMCKECHNEYHKHGVNSKTIEALQQKRHDFLMANGREEYANHKDVSWECPECHQKNSLSDWACDNCHFQIDDSTHKKYIPLEVLA